MFPETLGVQGGGWMDRVPAGAMCKHATTPKSLQHMFTLLPEPRQASASTSVAKMREPP